MACSPEKVYCSIYWPSKPRKDAIIRVFLEHGYGPTKAEKWLAAWVKYGRVITEYDAEGFRVYTTPDGVLVPAEGQRHIIG